MQLLKLILVLTVCVFPQAGKKSVKKDVMQMLSDDPSYVKITDITPTSSGSSDFDNFKINQTNVDLTIRHNDIEFFVAEIYNKQGHMVSEYRSSEGFDVRVTIPMNTFWGKTLFMSIKDSDHKVAKTFKCSHGEVYSSK